jgi:hypothetical protein
MYRNFVTHWIIKLGVHFAMRRFMKSGGNFYVLENGNTKRAPRPGWPFIFVRDLTYVS